MKRTLIAALAAFSLAGCMTMEQRQGLGAALYGMGTMTYQNSMQAPQPMQPMRLNVNCQNWGYGMTGCTAW